MTPPTSMRMPPLTIASARVRSMPDCDGWSDARHSEATSLLALDAAIRPSAIAAYVVPSSAPVASVCAPKPCCRYRCSPNRAQPPLKSPSYAPGCVAYSALSPNPCGAYSPVHSPDA